MSKKPDLLIEGSYLYFQNDVNYSQENFKLYHHTETSHYSIYAEILSRVENGEFLKVITCFEMSAQFIPYFVRTEKSIGDKLVHEILKYDTSSQELIYVHQTHNSTQEITRHHSSKHYLTSPAFSTSAVWTLTKKMDPTGRTPVTLVSSPNDWTYDSAPVDRIIFTEFKNRELENYKLNNSNLAASHLCLYEHDASSVTTDAPVDIFVSKHFAIPYQLVQGDMRIEIKTLKRHN